MGDELVLSPEELQAKHNVIVFKRNGFTFHEWAEVFQGDERFVNRKFWDSVEWQTN